MTSVLPLDALNAMRLQRLRYTVSLATMRSPASRLFRISLALAFMALAANCFLKYLWWAANYSVWQGIPKYANQWQAASARASFYGWSLLLLEIGSVAITYSLIRLRSIETSGLLWNTTRLIAAFVITIAGTALLAWALSLIKQSNP